MVLLNLVPCEIKLLVTLSLLKFASNPNFIFQINFKPVRIKTISIISSHNVQDFKFAIQVQFQKMLQFC